MYRQWGYDRLCTINGSWINCVPSMGVWIDCVPLMGAGIVCVPSMGAGIDCETNIYGD